LTVNELIEALQGVEPDRLIVLSRDGEGNGFRPLFRVGEEFYHPDHGGERLDGAGRGRTRCIVLRPED
jgi:hypothetical protein